MTLDHAPAIHRRSFRQAIDLLTLVIIVGLTLAHWWILIQQIRLAELLPFWFWEPHLTGLPAWGLALLLAALTAFVLLRVFNHPEQQRINLLLLILLGLSIQFSVALMEGRGTSEISNNMVTTGHSVFAREAVQFSSLADIFGSYPSLTGESPILATKPPGPLIIHWLAYRLSVLLQPLFPASLAPLDLLISFATYLFPALAYLVLVPLDRFAQPLLPDRSRYDPLILILFVPSITLMTLHVDEFLHPMLFTLALLLYFQGLSTGRINRFLAAGAVTYLALFVSFSMLAIPLFVLIAGLLIDYFIRDRFPEDHPLRPPHAFLVAHLTMITGFLILHILFALLWGYDLYGDFLRGTEAHQIFKTTDWTLEQTVGIGFTNLIEFAFWTGIPLTGLFLRGNIRAAGHLIKRQIDTLDVIALATGGLILALAFFSKTAAETGRLWIFLIPLMTIPAASELGHLETVWFRPGKWSRVLLVLIVGLQFASILMMKGFQDFY
ncbi:MAG: hypothetical protein K8J31_22745 [Anaerolineae bacterium]|nr:hypothetical protein [Anaerolineae bacterium]